MQVLINTVTEQMVKNWIGSDNFTREHLTEILCQLANGEYSSDQFLNDVLEYNEANLEQCERKSNKHFCN